VRNAHLAPEPGELGTGLIAHLPLLADAAPNLISQGLAGLDAGSNVSQQGRLSLQTPEQTLDPAPDPESAGNVEKVGGLKDGPALGIPYKWAHIMRATKRHTPLRVEQMARLPGLLQALANLGKHGRWLQGQNQIPSGRKRDVPRQAVKNLGEL
jgi:hypothetical protein